HEANHKGTTLSLDDMCRLVYQIAYNQFYNQFYNLLKGNTEEQTSESDIHTEAETAALFTPKHIIRKELVPAWLQAE
ncbi:hypothetical protein, partial [Paraburkholderia sp. SIMBA_053]|uniref:hypothetical protein n=1 Tax=Paraburkholderia sp. SIMBA_053 TaxID=3085794 RepID=UPI00397A9DB5